jgi:2-polyprenyl-3-methyl-5-hydroxy-6-metoxy-1,4-benzoquinol methylase
MRDGISGPSPAPGPICPICAHAGAVMYAASADRLFGIAPGRYLLHRCRHCGCIFQHPLPDVTVLSAFYPEQYWWSGGERTGLSRVFGRLERGYREFVARDHVRFLLRCAGGAGRGRSLLDIGCGSGTFLHLSRKRGFAAHGMDMSERAVAAARQQYDLAVRRGDIGGEVWKGHGFDFITMFHVLEHHPDPKEALRYAAGLLNPGGSLILQVPNTASLQGRLFGARWYGLDVPRHLINFTPRAFAVLLDQTGLAHRIVRRFSLRDNPAALASSIAVWLDPIGRRGRGRQGIGEGALELLYFGLFLLALPPALIESLLGYGATIWVHAQRAGR